jgi:hypothetical protein
MRDWRTCRFCHKGGNRLVKYEVRHYAHTECLVNARGEEFLLTLAPGAISNVEAFKISEATREALLSKLPERR